MEKVIRSSTMTTNASNTKELHYLLRMLAPAACRAPQMFMQLAKQILRVDFTLLSKRTGETEGQNLFELLEINIYSFLKATLTIETFNFYNKNKALVSLCNKTILFFHLCKFRNQIRMGMRFLSLDQNCCFLLFIQYDCI